MTTSPPPSLDPFVEIERLKRDRRAVIMAHYYQDPDIQDIADLIGDSLQLAQAATQTEAEVIVLAGVHFMAETAKILNPSKTVLVPDLAAGCSLADSCPPDRFKAFIDSHPGHLVVTYVNTSAATKALTDICVTSSNAERIIRQLPPEQPILFGPDQHLGRYIMKTTGREMTLWPGSCIVHEAFSEKAILGLRARHPEALVIAHPECEETILQHADHIGSTSGLLSFVQRSDARAFIVATEEGIIHQMRKHAPDKTYIPAPTHTGCACSQCPFMRLNTLEKIAACLRDLQPQVNVPEEVRVRAERPIRRMLEMS
ncbi:MAG: quinolinate synthase NadA [Proteobacteria bacterium]|nr:quinolinate synthase NadA [Pseudomonadota bacterium]